MPLRLHRLAATSTDAYGPPPAALIGCKYHQGPATLAQAWYRGRRRGRDWAGARWYAVAEHWVSGSTGRCSQPAHAYSHHFERWTYLMVIAPCQTSSLLNSRS
jgi:hypothetical protein